MYFVGVPYTVPALNETRTGGTPYGASHVAFDQRDTELSQHEVKIARELGRRGAVLATRLA